MLHLPTMLTEGGMLRDDTTVRPDEAQPEDLLVVHPQRYLNSLKVIPSLFTLTNLTNHLPENSKSPKEAGIIIDY